MLPGAPAYAGDTWACPWGAIGAKDTRHGVVTCLSARRCNAAVKYITIDTANKALESDVFVCLLPLLT
jgi:hypothetical protein